MRCVANKYVFIDFETRTGERMNQTSDEDRLVEKVKSIREWITRGWEIKEKEEKIFRGMFVLGSDDFEKLGAKARTGKRTNQTNDEDRAEQKHKYIRG